MYKINRKLTNCIIRIEYNLDFNFFKFDIMELYLRSFYFQEFVSSGVCLIRSLSFRSLSFRSLSFRSLSFWSLSFRSLSWHPKEVSRVYQCFDKDSGSALHSPNVAKRRIFVCLCIRASAT